MSHDAETLAARFVADLMDGEERRTFEAHLLTCDRCWGEVEGARQGRGLLEGLRAPASAQLRDRIRAVSDLEPDAPRGASVASGGSAGGAQEVGSRRRLRRAWSPRRGLLVAAGSLVLLAAGLGLGSLLAPGAPVEQVVALYEQPSAWSSSPVTPPAARLAGLRWVGARVGSLDGVDVVAHTYVGTEGSRITVVVGERGFPEPDDARSAVGGDWRVEVDGVTVFCLDEPVPSLVVGDDPATVVRAAAALSRAEAGS